MKAKKLINLLSICLIILSASNAYSLTQKSVPIPGDKRLRMLTYQPNTMYEYTGFLKYAARIDLDPKETIQSITMGDPTGWQINPAGYRLFLKPLEVDATTNMVIITDKRIYYFEMYSKEAKNMDDPDLVFATSFTYPDIENNSNKGFIEMAQTPEEKSYVPDTVKDAAMLNFNYTMSGSKSVAPTEVFDDGEFTYFRFKDINQDYPAIFMVLPNGGEALINFRVSPEGYVVIERVTSQYTLRFGEQVVCVFNENMPLEKSKELLKEQKDKKSFLGVF